MWEGSQCGQQDWVWGMQVNKREERRLLHPLRWWPRWEYCPSQWESPVVPCGPESSHNTPVCCCMRQVALNGPELAGEKQLSETHRVRPRSLSSGQSMGIWCSTLHLPQMPLASACSVKHSVGCSWNEQESQHEINIFYAKTTHRLRTTTVIMWIPQPCALCLSCDLSEQLSQCLQQNKRACVCARPVLPSHSPGRGSPEFLSALPSGAWGSNWLWLWWGGLQGAFCFFPQ